MDIQKWFSIESPKEMSEAFAEISAIYYITQVAARADRCRSGYRAMEQRLQSIHDPSEWFAACMCLEAVAAQAGFELRRVR